MSAPELSWLSICLRKDTHSRSTSSAAEYIEINGRKRKGNRDVANDKTSTLNDNLNV